MSLSSPQPNKLIINNSTPAPVKFTVSGPTLNNSGTVITAPGTNPTPNDMVFTNQVDERIKFYVDNNNKLCLGGINLDTQIVTSNLLSWYRLEEGPDTSANAFKDSAFTRLGVGDNPGVSLTLTGTVTRTPGFSGDTISFLSSPTISNNSTGGVTGNTNRTVQFWMKADQRTDAGNSLVGFGGDTPGANNGWEVIYAPYNTTGSFYIQGGSGGGNNTGFIDVGMNVNTGLWYNIAASWDGSNVRFYVNGLLKNTFSYSHTYSTSAGLAIGAISGNTAKEIVDEVLFYNAKLTDAQILQNYNSYFNYTLNYPIVTSGLVSLWQLEEGTISTSNAIKDTAYLRYGIGDNPGNSATLAGSPVQVLGVAGEGLSFDNNSAISIPQPALNDTASFSVSMWIKDLLNTNSNNDKLFIQADSNGANNRTQCEILNGGDVYFIVGNNGGDFINITVSDYPTSGWWNLTIVFDGSAGSGHTEKMYVNGVLKAEGGTVTAKTAMSAGQYTIFGSDDISGTSSQSSHLKFDEISYYSSALSGAQVLQNYNAYV